MEPFRALDQKALDTLFLAARTYSGWLDKDVPDSLVCEIFDLAKMGPTSANCSPMRAVFVRTPEGKEKLLPLMDKGNVEKTKTAPVVAIFAQDRKFYEYLPKLYPHTDAKSWFAGKPEKIEDTMRRNATLQAAYFILAARAKGIDCGPMSGFNAKGVKDAFFPDLDGVVDFVCNLGYGNPDKLHPRAPRFAFDEVCEFV